MFKVLCFPRRAERNKILCILHVGQMIIILNSCYVCVVLGKDSVDHVLNYFDGQLEALKEGAVLATVSLDGKESA